MNYQGVNKIILYSMYNEYGDNTFYYLSRFYKSFLKKETFTVILFLFFANKRFIVNLLDCSNKLTYESPVPRTQG